MVDIEKAFQEANSRGSEKGHELEVHTLTLIGTRIMHRRRYLIYEDQDKHYWYETEILTQTGWLPEEIAIFGRKLRR